MRASILKGLMLLGICGQELNAFSLLSPSMAPLPLITARVQVRSLGSGAGLGALGLRAQESSDGGVATESDSKAERLSRGVPRRQSPRAWNAPGQSNRPFPTPQLEEIQSLDVQAGIDNLLASEAEGRALGSRTPAPDTGIRIASVALIGAALTGMLTVVAISHNVAWDETDFSDWFSLSIPMVVEGVEGISRRVYQAISHNAPRSLFCFIISDLVAQQLEQKDVAMGLRTVNWKRARNAGFLGCLINGIGFDLWLGQLDNVFPPESGLGLGGTAAEIGAKTLTNSLIWGTLANSFSIVSRRVLEGSSPYAAVQYWSTRVIEVTSNDLRFFPVWNTITFSAVPHDYQVSFVAMGALIFNIYISLVANARAARDR